MVSEKANSLFYESEMVERDLHNYIKKYRNTHSNVEIKQLCIKLTDLTKRCIQMSSEYPVNLIFFFFIKLLF